MSVHVVLSTGTSSRFTNDEKSFDIDARSVRGIIKEMDERFPGIKEMLEHDTMVAINGELFEDALYQTVPDGAEVFFLPKLEAG